LIKCMDGYLPKSDSNISERLKKEIQELIDQLEKGLLGENSIESLVLSHLKRILAVMAGSDKDKSAGVLISDLRQFWLDSVPWCSELSKNIEKLIIMYGESGGRVD
jgi:hypothetical protein